MCKLEAHVHVHCGCVSKTVIISRCQALSRLPGIRKLYCAYQLDTATTKIPAEDLPCCERCYPAKRQEMLTAFQGTQDQLVETYVQKRYTEEHFYDLVRQNKEEFQSQVDLLERPYQRRLRDAIAYGRLRIVNGGDGY